MSAKFTVIGYKYINLEQVTKVDTDAYNVNVFTSDGSMHSVPVDSLSGQKILSWLDENTIL